LTRRITRGRCGAAGLAALALAGCMGTEPDDARPVLSAAGANGVDFGATLLTTTKRLDFRLTNSDAGFQKVAPLGNIGITVSGTSLTVGHSCPTVLNEGESCFITVAYAPTVAAAALTGELRVTSDAASGPTVLALTGSAVATLDPAAGAVRFDGSPSSDFGTVARGSSVDRTFTVRNIGNANDTVTVAGPTQSGWSFSHTCTEALVPNATCTVTVRFAPTTTGTSTPTALTVTDDYNKGYGGLTLQPVGVGQ
jgi:hypothetical protein